MPTNINVKTGVPYGLISANALHPELVDELLFGAHAIDETEQECRQQALAWAMREWHETNPGQDPNDFEDTIDEMALREFGEGYGADRIDEHRVRGTHHGVQYATCWLGGALNFWIFESPHVTNEARKASPCVPNAAILDTLDGSEYGYDVPADWRAES